MSLAGVTKSIGWQHGCLLGEGHFSPQQREVGFPFNLSEGRREITSHLQETRNNFWSSSIIFLFLFVCLVSIYWHDIALKWTTMRPKCTTYIMWTIQSISVYTLPILFLASFVSHSKLTNNHLFFLSVPPNILLFHICDRSTTSVHNSCPSLLEQTLIRVNGSDSKARQPV